MIDKIRKKAASSYLGTETRGNSRNFIANKMNLINKSVLTFHNYKWKKRRLVKTETERRKDLRFNKTVKKIQRKNAWNINAILDGTKQDTSLDE